MTTKNWVMMFILAITMTAATAQADQQPNQVACEMTADQAKEFCEEQGYTIAIGNAQMQGGAAATATAESVSSEPAAATATASAAATCDCAALASEVEAIKKRLTAIEAAVAKLRRSGSSTATATATSATTTQAAIARLEALKAQIIREAQAGFERRFARIKRVNARQDRELQALRDADTTAADRFARIKRVNARQDLEIATLVGNDAVQDARLEGQYEIDQMQNVEISDLRRERKFAEVGLNAGALLLAGWDYDYVSGVVGGQLTLRVGDRWYISGAPGLLITSAERPFGALIQLNVGYDLLGDFSGDGIPESSYATGSIEFGGMITSTQLNNQFEGKYVSIEPAVGFVYRFENGLRLNGYIHGGPKGDRDGNLSATIGGLALLGYDFGSRH
jgi:hypothetical protein